MFDFFIVIVSAAEESRFNQLRLQIYKITVPKSVMAPALGSACKINKLNLH